jgi:polysaccharide pyruvyl transferase WcaK-like protein
MTFPDESSPDEDSYGRPTASHAPRIGILGATLGTGNLGVDALGISMVQGVLNSIPNAQILFQCWDRRHPVEIPLAEQVHRCEGIVFRQHESWRHHDSIARMRKLIAIARRAKFLEGLCGISKTLRQLKTCDAVLDISAGDSFADIYGNDVFDYQSRIKYLCLEAGVPLVLMPQTYGPFQSSQTARTAGDILTRAAMVCTREADGEAEVRQLCGAAGTPPLLGVPDLAFGLLPTTTELPPGFDPDPAAPIIGLNVSGLLYFGRRKLRLNVDFADLVGQLIQWALAVPNSRVLLVPHVLQPTSGQAQGASPTKDCDDLAACTVARDQVPAAARNRVSVLTSASDAARAKYAIGRCDFFVGARMHSFIAAASQAVPGALLAYSKKAAGLTQLVGIGDSVVDLRTLDATDCVGAVDKLFTHREALRSRLEARLPDVKRKVDRFFFEHLAPLILGKRPPSPATAAAPHETVLAHDVHPTTTPSAN